MQNSFFNMVIISSYGNQVFETLVLEKSTINDVRQKYLEIAGKHLSTLFDRNFGYNSNCFLLPYAYNSIKIYAVK